MSGRIVLRCPAHARQAPACAPAVVFLCRKLPGIGSWSRSSLGSDFEFIGAQRVEDASNMIGASDFQHQLDFGFADRHLSKTARLADLQDVGAQVGDTLREPRKAAWADSRS